MPAANVTVFFCLQLFWEKKLSGLNAYDIAEELVKTMELPKGLQGNIQLKLNMNSSDKIESLYFVMFTLSCQFYFY